MVHRKISEEAINKHGYKSVVIIRESSPSTKEPLTYSFDANKKYTNAMPPVLIAKKMDGTEMKVKGQYAIDSFLDTLV